MLFFLFWLLLHRKKSSSGEKTLCLCQSLLKKNRPGVWVSFFFIAKRPKPVTGLHISVTEPADYALGVMLGGSMGLPITGANHPFPDHLAAMQRRHQGRTSVGCRSVSPGTFICLAGCPEATWGQGWSGVICTLASSCCCTGCYSGPRATRPHGRHIPKGST